MAEKMNELVLLGNMYNIVKSSTNRQMEMIELYYQNTRTQDLCEEVGLNLGIDEVSSKEVAHFEILITNKTVRLNKL